MNNENLLTERLAIEDVFARYAHTADGYDADLIQHFILYIHHNSILIMSCIHGHDQKFRNQSKNDNHAANRNQSPDEIHFPICFRRTANIPITLSRGGKVSITPGFLNHFLGK